MKITFLAHSGFLVEWDKFYTLFDFYKGDLPDLDPQKPLLVFASHRHDDHFDPRIFSLPGQYPTTQFFLSRDVSLTQRRRKWLHIDDETFARCTMLRHDELLLTQAAGEELSIRTIKSTDIGVAFLLRSEGKLIYHAGDLNWWHWESEGQAYCNNMAANYHRAIDKLLSSIQDEALDSGCTPKLSAAMVPLDPRLEKAYDMGLSYLLKMIPVDHVFPMHMWEKFETIDQYCLQHPEHEKLIAHIARDGQSFAI